MSETETAAPFKISQQRSISMPLALLGSLLALTALGVTAWTSTRQEVESTKKDVQNHTTEILELKTDARAQREILIRIDENVKDLRRSDRRTTP